MATTQHKIYINENISDIKPNDLGGRMVEFEIPSDDVMAITGMAIKWSYIDSSGKKVYMGFNVLRGSVDMLLNVKTYEYYMPTYSNPYYLVYGSKLNKNKHKAGDGAVPATNRIRVRVFIGDEEPGLTLEDITVYYIGLPKQVNLTEEELYTDEADSSEIIEFPLPAVSMIINKTVGYLLENKMDPRTQSHAAMHEDLGTPSLYSKSNNLK